MSTRGAISLVLLSWLIGARAAASGQADDRAEKVRYLLNFTEYVEWPASAFANAKSPIVIGVIGEDPFGEALTKQAAEHRGQRRVEVRRFKGIREFRGQETPGRRQDELEARKRAKREELRACHVLYVSQSEDAVLSEVLGAVRKAPVLTVGEKPAFARQGGVIDFFRLAGDPRLRFEINLAAAKAANLKVSSKLLALAKPIHEEDAQAKP